MKKPNRNRAAHRRKIRKERGRLKLVNGKAWKRAVYKNRNFLSDEIHVAFLKCFKMT